MPRDRIGAPLFGTLVLLAACGSVIVDPVVERDAGTGDGGSVDAGRLGSLTVEVVGPGVVRIDDRPCSDRCVDDFEIGHRVRLEPMASAGAAFGGWSGACAGETVCELDLESDVSLTATFEAGRAELVVLVLGGGLGEVRAPAAGLACPPTCAVTVDLGASVELVATPTAPDAFEGWGGACAGSVDRMCRLTVASSTTVEVTFGGPGGFARFSQIVDLGGVPNAIETWAQNINERSDVVGWSQTSTVAREAIRIASESSTVVALDRLSKADAVAWDINDTGWTIGESVDAQGRLRAVLWSPAPSLAVVDLGTLGGAASVAYGINANNWIVGRAEVVSGQRHAFVRDPRGGDLVDLGTLGGAESVASDVNDLGWIVGSAYRADGQNRAFRAQPPDYVLVELGTLGGLASAAAHINELGAIAGTADVPGGNGHAFYLPPPPATALVDIGTLGGATSLAYRMNDRGVVVGTSQDSSSTFRAFIWSAESRVLVDLNDLLPDGSEGWELTYARSINNRGQVVGVGVHEGALRGFFLEP